MDIIQKPKLVEPGVRYFFNATLNQCRVIKEKYYNFIFNLVLFVLFIVLVAGVLYYNYKGRISKEERAIKLRKQQEYIVSKLQFMQETKKNTNLITELPIWNQNPEVEIYNKKIFK
tara:strand:+ start:4583 stop:4930 length:348 start_codon:yes stop_codon:yes gene_type:complete